LFPILKLNFVETPPIKFESPSTIGRHKFKDKEILKNHLNLKNALQKGLIFSSRFYFQKVLWSWHQCKMFESLLNKEQVQTITSDEDWIIKVVESKTPVIVDFYAEYLSLSDRFLNSFTWYFLKLVRPMQTVGPSLGAKNKRK
jgi:hypothetical protein